MLKSKLVIVPAIALAGVLLAATSSKILRAADAPSANKTPEAAKAHSGLLDVGDLAPDFTLPSATGEQVTLSSFKGKKTVVLYFYPKDFTPGCTMEAESFRDENGAIERAGAVVLGVSVDDVTSHKAFAKDKKLNFTILSDVEGKVARQYGVMGWIMAKRVTYIIGKDGKVEHVFPDVNPDGHSQEVLKVLRAMAPPMSEGRARAHAHSSAARARRSHHARS